MTYSDVYIARLNHKGSTIKQRQYYYGVQDFEKYLAQSPSSVNVTIDDVDTLASILSNKQNEYELTKKILTRLTTSIHPGSRVIWDGEHWIVYQRVKQPNETYNTCWMTRCNQQIKWIDEYGVLRSDYCYVVGAEDSKIKANFRTWNSLITPQPNQYMQILVPTSDNIVLGQRFIINERAWKVIEYDKDSAPGLTYYSLTEDKVDRQDDDSVNHIADVKDENKVVIRMPDISIAVNQTMILNAQVFDDGDQTDLDVIYTINDSTIAKVEDNKLTGLKEGNAIITISLVSAPQVTTIVNVQVAADATARYVLEGPQAIRCSERGVYRAYLISESKQTDSIVSYVLSNSLATGQLKNGILYVIGNETGSTGTVQVTITTAHTSYTKTLTIKGLW